MPHPWINTALLIVLSLQLMTGLGALMSGAPSQAWIAALHGIGAYAAVLALGWKSVVIVQTIQRRPRITPGRIAFLLLTALLLLTLVSGYLWTYGGPSYLGGFSLLTVHGFLAVALILLLIWHTAARWFIVRVPASTNRRMWLRLAGLSLAGVFFWRSARPLQAALDLPGAQRRFTGSYETGSFTGVFPRVIWLFDNPAPIDVNTWTLQVDGAVTHPRRYSLTEIASLAQETSAALLDCTGGWYTEQEWRGLPLRALLDAAAPLETARSVTVESITGYRRRFALDELDGYLLATHVADAPLAHGHGYPLRLVAPNRRGYEWVKWIVRIHVNESGAHWQSPLPLQ